MRTTFAFLTVLFFIYSAGKAQNVDSLYNSDRDTLLAQATEDYSKRFDPGKASLYSAVLPGLGQAYTKKYWKIPIIYGGFTALVLTVDFYHGHYTRFRTDLFAEIDNNPRTQNLSGFNEQQLRRLVDQTRRERDYFIIISGVFYILQIAEAHITAHLKEFELNPELKVQVQPTMRYAEGLNSGILLTFKF
jgi:hypothetical protein